MNANGDGWAICESVGVGVAVLIVLAAAPFAAIWLHGGSTHGLTAVEAVVGSCRVVSGSHWADPAVVFPGETRTQMPSALGWWTAAGWSLATVAAVAIGTWRRLDVLTTSSRAGRRPYDLRGSRTRAWARPRDLESALVHGREPARFTLGRIDGRLLASGPESHVAVIAPTRSGKTTRFVIPWLLEHDGPAIVTSTKLDVVEATEAWRARRGKCWIWDPFGDRSAAWTPLHRCDEWSYALAQAQWLADASQEGDSEIAAYWRGEAAKLLAPLLHAAALDGRSMVDVLGWLDKQDAVEPGGILADAGRIDARRQITSVVDLDARNRGTTYMSAGSLLSAFRYPQVEASAEDPITAERLFDGGPHTLYIVAAARHQRLLAPLVVGMLSSLLHEAAERARRAGPLEPTLRVLMDEAANIAPLRDLPAHLSQAAGHGVRIATIWQSLSQLQDRYRTAADGILANSTAKVFMGPVSDERTRDYIQGLAGQVPAPSESRTEQRNAAMKSSRTKSIVWRPAVSAAELQQLAGRAVVIEGSSKPAVMIASPWWEDGSLRRRLRG